MHYFRLSEITPFISAICALAAIFIGPFITLYAIEKKSHFDVRNKWMEDFRKVMGMFIAKNKIILIKHQGVGLLSETHFDELNLQKILELEQEILLLLDPKAKDHLMLIEVIKSISDDAEQGSLNLIDNGIKIDTATKLSRKILSNIK